MLIIAVINFLLTNFNDKYFILQKKVLQLKNFCQNSYNFHVLTRHIIYSVPQWSLYWIVYAPTNNGQRIGSWVQFHVVCILYLPIKWNSISYNLSNSLIFFPFQVLVMTPAILLTCLRHSFFKLSMIKVLIIDECHHARGKHPYACIMTVSCLYLFPSNIASQSLAR